MVSKRPTVLIVDDDEAICDLVCEDLAGEGYSCDVASNADDALAKLKRQSFDLALLDIKLPGMSGMDLLKTVQKCYQMTAIVMITGVNDVDTAVEAMKLGASDYIVKPFTLYKLNASIRRVLNNSDNDRLLSEINAIAYGIDAQIDHFDFHSKIVAEKTVELARWLGLPRKEIEKWATAREGLYSERDRQIKSAISKLERNLMAQEMLGLTSSVRYFLKSGEQD